MKNSKNWKDNWFGSWLDIDIVTGNNTALKIKKGGKRAEIKDGEAVIKESCKKYIDGER
tara:strand:+ start:503 stop:679 length:177 start_codon:yes stop_codon:yes gene_type:complete